MQSLLTYLMHAYMTWCLHAGLAHAYISVTYTLLIPIHKEVIVNHCTVTHSEPVLR